MSNRGTMTVVILLLECFSGRAIDFHFCLHMFYYSFFNFVYNVFCIYRTDMYQCGVSLT